MRNYLSLVVTIILALSYVQMTKVVGFVKTSF